MAVETGGLYRLFQYPQRIVGDFNALEDANWMRLMFEFQYPQRIVGDFNVELSSDSRSTEACFSILNGSWVTSTIRGKRYHRFIVNGFSILNGSWVTSTRQTLAHPLHALLFQYPQRIVGDFNRRGCAQVARKRLEFQYPQRIVGDFNLAEYCQNVQSVQFQYPQRIVGDFNRQRPADKATRNVNVSVSSTDRG